MPHAHKSVAITDRSSIGEARRAAVASAQALGFHDERRSNVGIVATELASNALLHGQGGELLVCPTTTDGGACLDLIALDSGPGIRDIGRAMEDGFSTIGTAGQGLGAIGRLSDASSLYSVADKGTAYWSRFATGSPSAAGVVNIPFAEETVAGDSYLIHKTDSRSLYMMVDGLGHGAGAAEAAEEAILTVNRHRTAPLVEIIHATHNALKKTRGAAMAIACIDTTAATLTYAGIGNVSSLLVNGVTSRSLVSQNGTLGAAMPRTAQEFLYPFDRDTLLVMFTDGLTSKANPTVYAGFQKRPPMLLAGLLYRDFSRRRDDATVLVAHLGGERA